MYTSLSNQSKSAVHSSVLLSCALILLFVLPGAPLAGQEDTGTRGPLMAAREPDTLPRPELHDPGEQLAKGKFLIARKQIKDPRFMETVILLVSFEKDGTVGLIINRPTKVLLSEVLQMEEAKEETDSLHYGGPVAMNQLVLLIRADSPPEGSLHVFDNVYATSSLATLKRMLGDSGSGSGGEKFRVYIGYAGWAAGQLEREILRGDWYVAQADAGTVFDAMHSSIWPDLIRRFSGIQAGREPVVPMAAFLK